MSELKKKLRDAASAEFTSAEASAIEMGVNLIKHCSTHYAIRGPGWFHDLWPSTQKIFPELIVPRPWKLSDALNAAVAKHSSSNERRGRDSVELEAGRQTCDTGNGIGRRYRTPLG